MKNLSIYIIFNIFYIFKVYIYFTVIFYYKMNNLSGKVAIITASSTGIGKGIAQSLGKQGVKVIISSRDQMNVNKTTQQLISKGYQAFGVVCDVGKKEDRTKLILQTIKKFGKINFLILNAATATKIGNFIKQVEQQIDNVWNINFKSVFFMVQEALPYLKKQKNNSIVIISSYAAYDLPNIIGHYAITKTALVALTKILAKQLIGDQIRVNCVCPGIIKTGFSQPLWASGQKQVIKRQGLTRLGVPSDIAGVVKFLCSSDSQYMTGESIGVAGKLIPRL